MRTQTAQCRAEHGFTLIELLLVLVLLGVSSSFAVVSVNRLVSRWQERALTTEILNVLKMARVSAMAGGGVVTVAINPLAAVSASSSAGWRKTVAFKEPYQLGTGEPAKLTYVFWPDGSVESGAFSLMRGGSTVRTFVLSGPSQSIRVQ